MSKLFSKRKTRSVRRSVSYETQETLFMIKITILFIENYIGQCNCTRLPRLTDEKNFILFSFLSSLIPGIH